MAFVQMDIPLSSQNIGFSSAKIRALSGVYHVCSLYMMVRYGIVSRLFIHAEHVVHRRGYCFHFGCMYVCMFVCMLAL